MRPAPSVQNQTCIEARQLLQVAPRSISLLTCCGWCKPCRLCSGTSSATGMAKLLGRDITLVGTDAIMAARAGPDGMGRGRAVGKGKAGGS